MFWPSFRKKPIPVLYGRIKQQSKKDNGKLCYFKDSITGEYGKEALSNNKNLSIIEFKGTCDDWIAMEKGKSWKYNVPATKVSCNDGENKI